ncbi:cytochrome c-type biogenesis protein [Azorhizobium doebereinerae]|uniref:cytochrome c-type biogenesis protein n=1 Tax=Azorhizobium doebereinerae TaxID=281091 RepID=UPI003CC90EC4
MARLRSIALVLLLLLSGAVPAFAVQPDEVLADPALEARARELSRELRCMVCQNQSIDDSDAPLARDLRLLVRDRLKAGDSDRQVLDFLVARYGEFVLMRPVFSLRNALLWGAPLLVLVLGACAAFLTFRRRAEPEVLNWTAEEEARVQALLAAEDAADAGDAAPEPGAVKAK